MHPSALCFIFFEYRKSLDKRRRVSTFSAEINFSHTAEKFCRGTLSVSLFSGIQIVWIRGVGEYQDFPSKIICLTVPRNFVGETFFVALISGTENVWIRGGGGVIRIFCRKIFASQCR